jgi:hypothetical protein
LSDVGELDLGLLREQYFSLTRRLRAQRIRFAERSPDNVMKMGAVALQSLIIDLYGKLGSSYRKTHH